MTYAPPPADMARCPGPSMQDLLKSEGEVVPTVLREESYVDYGDNPIPVERYTSQAFHDREVEHLWRKVWQMVGRTEQIPNVGDHLVYDIADDSLLVTRVSETEIKAYYNACLHRGTRLRDEGGHVPAFRCPFHGFTWGLDGTLKGVPCRWDFPTLKDEDFQLPEARVATWGGFVFINMDPDCVPLEEYLGDVAHHFDAWPLEERYLAAHVSKIVHGNWKVAQEAFMEAYHVPDTHPQFDGTMGDWNGQYDVYPGGHSRIYHSSYTPSPRMSESLTDPLSVQAVEEMSAEFIGLEGPLEVPAGKNTRQALAKKYRHALETKTGADLSGYTTTEMVDQVSYFFFPNFFPWAGFGTPLLYRFRPNGNDPDSCIMEIMLMAPRPKQGPCPAPAQHRRLGPDEAWADAVELGGGRAAVFDQDATNIPRIQAGLKTTRKSGILPSHYQEVRIRHMHHMLEQYLDTTE